MKTNLFLTLCSLIAAVSLCAQDAAKSVRPLEKPKSETPNPTITRALVVGISDYQHRDIPDLQFADKDAKAFADWLKSKAGGSVPTDNITLLTNAEATNAAVGTTLSSMLDVCKPGDRFLFYFSGHGDVETKTRNQPGYLLCHDSPANVYMVGALNLRDLQEIVSTLSENQVKVTLITDACHAGKLAGAGIGGTQATASAMSKQFANEVKIMSCQPNEFSLEGQQWGGGRGVFSYNLLEGLTGLSDRNGDGVVNLLEITRYLQDEVPAATAPHSQLPMSVGDLQAPLNTVDAPALAALKTTKAGATASIAATGSKGLEDDILAKTDEPTRQRYLDFKKALAQRAFFEPKDACADAYFRHLAENPELAPLLGLMTRNYAVALLDEVQQALNALLDNDPYEANNWRFNPEKYAQYPAYLARSIELLGEKHYLARSMLAKKRYFEGYNLFKNVGELQNDPARRDSFKLAAREKYRESLRLQPEAAYVHYAIGQSFSYEANPAYQTDSVLYWCEKALELAPGWILPYMEMFNEHGNAQWDLAAAETCLNRALAIAPDNYLLFEKLSWLKQWQDKADESLAISKKMIAMRPDIFNAYSTAAHTLTCIKGEHLESEKYCLKSLDLQPNQLGWAYNLLGINYLKTRRTALAIEHFKKGLTTAGATSFDKIQIGSFMTLALIQHGELVAADSLCKFINSLPKSNAAAQAWNKAAEGKLYLLQNRLEDAEKALQNVFVVDPTLNGAWCLAWALLGEIETRRGHLAEAEAYFQKAATIGFVTERNLFFDEAIFRYGRFLLDQRRTDEAEAKFREIGTLLPKSYYHGYGMALLAAKQRHKTEALDWLERSLDNFYPESGSIMAEPLFAKIRKTKRFKAIMEKHFPLGWAGR